MDCEWRKSFIAGSLIALFYLLFCDCWGKGKFWLKEVVFGDSLWIFVGFCFELDG